MLKSRIICDTTFTVDWLCEILCKPIKIKPNLVKWSCEKIGDQKGFFSFIIVVNLEWSDPDTTLPSSVVLKVPAVAPIQNPALARPLTVHEREAFFYKMFSNTPGLPLPKVYHSQSRFPVMVIEDLSQYSMGNVVDGLSLEQLHSLIDALAALHAKSLSDKKWVDQLSRFQPSKETAKHAELRVREEGVRKMKSINPEFVDVLYKCHKNIDPDSLIETMDHSHAELGIPPVVVNGDLWVNNLFWQRNDDSTLMAIIDWQTIRAGNLMEDLVCILFASCHTDLRRKECANLVSFYHKCLAKHMGDKMIFTLAQIRKAYNAILPVGAAFMVFSLPFWLDMEELNVEESRAKILRRATRAVNDVWSE